MSKPLSKKKASMLNMALMGAYQIVTALFGFVLPSMILNTYGASLHGYTTTVSNIMSYVATVSAAGVSATVSSAGASATASSSAGASAAALGSASVKVTSMRLAGLHLSESIGQ